MPTARLITLLGAESTGKTTLANDLGATLQQAGHSTAVVPEALREFCDRLGRTPHRSEQAGIAEEQTRRIRAARLTHDIVVADTSALMIAVYSDMVFTDTSLYEPALQAHADADLTLLTALDLPWLADGLQRDGPHVREPVDQRIRAALQRARLPYSVVFGNGARRQHAALASLLTVLGLELALTGDMLGAATDANASPKASNPAGWVHWCDRCGDPDCERHTFKLAR
jgi:nicotinamide riboside kinase